MKNLFFQNIKFRKKQVIIILFLFVTFLVLLLLCHKSCFARQFTLVYGYPMEMLYTNKVANIVVDNSHPFMIVLGCNREVHLKPKVLRDFYYIPGDFVNATDSDLLLRIEAPEFWDIDEKFVVPRRQWEHCSMGLTDVVENVEDAITNSCITIFNQQTQDVLCKIYFELTCEDYRHSH